MKEQWFKYLSEQNNEELIPTMIDFFNDVIDFDELNEKVANLDLVDFYIFKKNSYIDDILGED
tara:strand:- start:54253 stop:54441 length:189 start_codon:yes stop_codon:yes gene_type:complete